jgi:TM2 domain-containing membrane protein YozV
MSSSVSQLEFWREASSDANEKNNSEEGGEGGTYLSYNVLMGLSVLGGFFALDHLYLRSPLTFLAKIAVNILCFGVWWLYDASQIVFNSHAVKVFGLGVPGLGPQGVAGGVFANPVPDKKHMTFFIYALSLLLGGVFGLDSFILGNNRSGVIRLICLISVIFAPIALGWWAYNLFNFFFDTKTVISEQADFFGAPHHSFKSGILSKFPFLGALFSPLDWVKTFLHDLVGDAIQPITNTAQMAIGTMDSAIKTADDTVQLGREAISKGANIVDQISNTVEKVSQATQILPGVSLYSSITPGSVQKELGKGTEADAKGNGNAVAAAMVGGAMMTDLKPIHYILLVTIVTIVLGGVIVTYHRSKNVPVHDERDDSPPQPPRVPETVGAKRK